MTAQREGTDESATHFWEAHYHRKGSNSSGRPSHALVRFVEGRPAGRALELGCARGDDAIWLARQGWTVTGVDIASNALDYARRNARSAGVSDAITFERHDLTRSLPEGSFDLVCALFLQSPVAFDRHEVLRRASTRIPLGGCLLVASHGSVAPWSWGDPDRTLPTADEEWSALGLDDASWSPIFVGPSERVGHGPDGRTATVIDTLIVVERQARPGPVLR